MDNYISISEVSLVKETGVTKARFVKLRKEASKEVHWYYGESSAKGRPGAVMWTREGKEWLKAQLGDWEAVCPPESLPAAWSDSLWAEVKRLPLNGKMLLCEVNGETLKVLTRSQSLFKIGMSIPIKKLDKNIYAVEKYPRRKGQY